MARKKLEANVNYFLKYKSDQIRSDQSLSRVRLFATPWTTARQASLSITNSWSSLRLTSTESVMPSNHLILCRPLLIPNLFLARWQCLKNGYIIIHIRMAITKKIKNNKCWWREIETLVHFWWECKMVIVAIEKRYGSSLKIKNRTAIWFSNPSSGVYSAIPLKARTQEDISTPMFIAALFTTIKMWKQPKCPLLNEWKNKM